MSRAADYLWLIPALPAMAAALSAFAKQRQRKLAASLAIGSMWLALMFSCAAFVSALERSGQYGEAARQVFNFPWFQFGDRWLKLGWVLDPLAAVMLVMVSLEIGRASCRERV